MNKKEKIFIFFILLFVAIVYILIFPMNLGKSTYYRISDFIVIDETKNNKGIPDGYCNFNGGIFYYSSKLKTINYSYKPKNEETIASNLYGFCVYNKVGQKVLLYDNSGSLKKEILTKNYPYFYENYPIVYFIKTNGSGFFAKFITGEPFIEDFSTDSFITSITLNEKLETSIGLLDGRGYLLDNKGNLILNLFFKESKINITKNIIADNDYIYSISGIDDEYFKVIEKNTEKTIFETKTNGDLRYKPIMRDRNRYIFFEQEGYIVAFDKKNKKMKKYYFDGELIEYDINSQYELTILTKLNDKYILAIYDKMLNRKYYNEIYGDVSDINYLDSNRIGFRVNDYIIILNKKEA